MHAVAIPARGHKEVHTKKMNGSHDGVVWCGVDILTCAIQTASEVVVGKERVAIKDTAAAYFV